MNEYLEAVGCKQLVVVGRIAEAVLAHKQVVRIEEVALE